jgi:DNA polymerase-1
MSEIFSIGRKDAPIVVITDWSPPSGRQRGTLMNDAHSNFLLSKFREAGISMADVVMVNPCPMNAAWVGQKPPTAKKHREWIDQFSEEFITKLGQISTKARVIIALGKTAAHQLNGKAVAVTKARGSFSLSPTTGETPVMITLSPAHALSRPEVQRDFNTDLRMVVEFQERRWKGGITKKKQGKYELCTDLSDWIENPPDAICGDTETTGLRWAHDATLLCVSLTVKEGESRIIPINGTLFSHVPLAERRRGVAHLKQLAANPKIKWFGHNFKFDLHMMSLMKIHIANWWMDTLQLVFAADENMLSKSLSEATRRWVPAMAGYSDEFDAAHNKGKLIEANPDDVVKYAGGDTDATFRLCKVLVEEIMRDKKQWKTVTRVQMPSLRMFYLMEKQGMSVDRRKLRELGLAMAGRAFEIEQSLMKRVPKKVKQKHFDTGLSFSRKEFLQDVLFSADGFGLKVFSTVANGTPSTDAIHLSNHASNTFVQDFTEFQKVSKMRSTYVGLESSTVITEIGLLKNGGWPAQIRNITTHEPEDLQGLAKLEIVRGITKSGDGMKVKRVTEWDDVGSCLAVWKGIPYRVSQSAPTGFWKHIVDDGRIHPSFFLDKTVTGRTSSRDPNFQNVPKRGVLAKPFRRVFVPSRKGYVFLECDESQAELRVAAAESLDPTMLHTYRKGGDIHAMTASKVAGVPMSEVTKDLRQKAKAVNFGFLYTMGVDGFLIYAKTQYGVVFTKSEATAIRNKYFETYPKLKIWHDRRRQEVRRNGFVRALHGARRNLPAIHSADRGVQAEAERQAINSPVQRFGSDMTLLAMVQFCDGAPDYILPVGTVHDSGLVETPLRKHRKVASWMKWCFINPPLEQLFGVKLPLPLGADVCVGENLGDMEDMENVDAVKPPWIVI